MTIRDTLDERGKRYGDYEKMALVAQRFKATIAHFCDPSLGLEEYQNEALDLICTKIARIIVGDPSYVDNWDDIAGYATLVSETLKKKANTK